MGNFQGLTMWFLSLLHREGERERESKRFLSLQCSTCICVSVVHVWCLPKCVNSDNTPVPNPWFLRDIAIQCLRCRKAGTKTKMHAEKEVQIGMDAMHVQWGGDLLTVEDLDSTTLFGRMCICYPSNAFQLSLQSNLNSLLPPGVAILGLCIPMNPLLK